MHIASSAIQLQSSHSLLEYQHQRESLSVWRNGPQGRQVVSMERHHERLHLSQNQSQLSLQHGMALQPQRTEDNTLPQRMRSLLPASPTTINAQQPMTPSMSIDNGEDETSATSTLDLKTAMLKIFVERLTGRKLELFDPAELNQKTPSPHLPTTDRAAPANQSERPQGAGMRYEFEQLVVEKESMHFSAQGVVHTADGRKIHLDLQLSMSREYIQHSRIMVQQGNQQLKDPLVINFSGHAAELSQTRYAFDLDANGILHEIPFVGPGSGFLALDKNGDGQINDGSELFGALSGNGFADLANYDQDGNGWIDANDEVFSRLLIWSKDEHGNDYLNTLEAHGIGAIYLAHTATPFAIKDQHNDTLGQVRASGIYLTERGMVGSVQQLDLVV